MNQKEIIETIRKELHQCNHDYYVLDAPTISDYEYDMKMKELEKLEEQYPEFYDPKSPTQIVGSSLIP